MQNTSPTSQHDKANTDASLFDYIKAWPQYPLPHNWLTSIIYKIMRSRLSWWKSNFIRWFIQHYRVDLSEAVETNPEKYEHFNAFFTRELKPDARTIHSATNSIICPVDGAISQFGNIVNGDVFQAKGRSYSLDNLLANNEQWIQTFSNGQFITLYLSPKDYHRIHTPSDSTLTAMRYVPGRLFSVNPATTRAVPGLFARNERLICAFDSPHGKFLLIMVGALFVSGIETVWHGEVSPPHGAALMHRDYPADISLGNNSLNNHPLNKNTDQPSFSRGDEIGRFNMGSTVVLLFEPNRIQWEKTLSAGKPVRMGSLMATMTS